MKAIRWWGVALAVLVITFAALYVDAWLDRDEAQTRHNAELHMLMQRLELVDKPQARQSVILEETCWALARWVPHVEVAKKLFDEEMARRLRVAEKVNDADAAQPTGIDFQFEPLDDEIARRLPVAEEVNGADGVEPTGTEFEPELLDDEMVDDVDAVEPTGMESAYELFDEEMARRLVEGWLAPTMGRCGSCMIYPACGVCWPGEWVLFLWLVTSDDPMKHFTSE